MNDYFGDDISIDEMPQGCVITSNNSEKSITISSTADALAIIKSLQNMIEIQMGDE